MTTLPNMGILHETIYPVYAPIPSNGNLLNGDRFQYPDLTENSKISLSVAAGVLYL